MSQRGERRFGAARFELIRSGIAVPQVAIRTAAIPDALEALAAGAHAFTDGERIVYDPAHIDALPQSERLGLVGEELIHTQLLHPWRMRALMEKESIPLGICQDAAEEAMLQVALAAHLDMTGHAPPDPEWEGYSLEAIARTKWNRERARQQNQPGPGAGGQQQGSGSPAGAGSPPNPQAGSPGATGGPGGQAPIRPATVLPAPDTASSQQQKAQVQAQLLAFAAGRGDLPAGLVRVVNQIRHPACRDLLEALLAWAANALGQRKVNDWGRPDRYVAQLSGCIMASKRRRGLPPIGCAVDTSGSVQPQWLARFTGGLQRVLDEAEPEALYAWACDAAIQATREYRPGDRVDNDWPGGGGTDFRPVFAAVAALPEDLAGLVYLTDLDGRFPEKEPPYPTLWVVPDRNALRRQPPWGTVIYLD